jgi:hypothetical protein
MTENDVDSIMAQWNWALIPSHMHGGVKRWVKNGIPPGDFLTLMLEHDVYGAIGRADDENQAAIVNWVKFMHNYLPGGCHGNEERVREWFVTGGMMGLYVTGDNDNDQRKGSESLHSTAEEAE